MDFITGSLLVSLILPLLYIPGDLAAPPEGEWTARPDEKAAAGIVGAGEAEGGGAAGLGALALVVHTHCVRPNPQYTLAALREGVYVMGMKDQFTKHELRGGAEPVRSCPLSILESRLRLIPGTRVFLWSEFRYFRYLRTCMRNVLISVRVSS